MSCNNLNLDLVNMNTYVKFGKNLSILSRNEILAYNSGTNVRKKKCNNPDLDLVRMNTCEKIGENL